METKPDTRQAINRTVKAIFPYVLSPILVGVTTFVLLWLQHGILGKGPGGVPRPFSIGYIIAIAVVTAVGGTAAGIVTLMLAVLSTIYFLMSPLQFSEPNYNQSRDLIELAALMVSGMIVIGSLDGLRRSQDRAAELLATSQEAQARLQAIMDTAPVGIITCDPNTKLTYANREAERIWGRSLLKVEQADWTLYKVLGVDGTPLKSEEMGLAIALRGGSEISREVIFEQPNGKRTPLMTSSTAIRDSDGRVLGALAVLADITVQKRAEIERERATEALRVSEERFRNVVTNAPVVVFALDQNGIFTFSDGKGLTSLGLNPGEVVGKSVYDIYTNVPGIADSIQRALQGEMVSWTTEIEGINFDVQCTPLHDENGKIIGLIGVSSDVTEQHKAQAEVVLSEQRFRSLVTATAQIVWSDSPSSRDNGTDAWCAYTGQTREEAEGMGWLNALHPEDRERSDAVWEEALRTKTTYDIEYRIRNKAGEYRYFSVRGVPVTEADGTFREWVGVITDIHDRKTAEMERARLLDEALIRAERASLINRIGQAQRATDDPIAVQQAAVDLLGSYLKADRCFFGSFDIDRDKGSVETEWYREGLMPIAGEYTLSDYGLDMRTLFPEATTLVINDTRTFPGTSKFVESLLQAGLFASVSVPIFDNDHLIADLVIAMADGPHEWTADAVELIEAVAAQTRTAMDLARAQQHDRKIAERLQDALTPVAPNDVPGLELADYYKAALEESRVGGDFFDVFNADKGCTALVIGDLSGKGLEAASQIATVRNMLRYAVYRNNTLSQAVYELNETLADQNLLTGFVTLCVAIYDSAEGKLSYVSCGHDPLLLRRRSGNVEMLEPTGPVLGAFSGMDFGESVVDVVPGDKILFYTDGISEAGRSRHDFLGSDGLATILDTACREQPSATPRQLIQSIVRKVDTHTDGAAHDDRCILLASVSGANR